jgi:hypothetical protein
MINYWPFAYHSVITLLIWTNLSSAETCSKENEICSKNNAHVCHNGT